MLRHLKKLSGTEIIMAIVGIALIIGQIWLDLTMPDYMSQVTQLITSTSPVISQILKNGAMMLVCALGSAILSMVVGFFTAKIGCGFSKRLRYDIYNKIQTFSKSEMKHFSTASLITRSTNDITQIQNFIAMGLQVLIKAPILAVWAVCKILGKNWQWSVVTGSAVLFLLVIIVTILIFCIPKFKSMQVKTDNLNRVTRENLTGLRVVRAFNAESFQQEKFDGANKDLTSTNLFIARRMSLLMPTMSFVMSMVSLLIYWVGAKIISDATAISKGALLGDMMVFMSYSVQIIASFMMLVIIFMILPRAMESARRCNEILDTKPLVENGNGEIDKENNLFVENVNGEIIANAFKAGEIEFKNVFFKYPDADENVLEDISFKLNKGEKVAFIGSTGSGKSTLIDLIPRFYDATSGEVLVDGINVKRYRLEDLYDKIGYVSQTAVMFTGTVSENVALGSVNDEKPNKENIESAVEISQAKEFVENMENTYSSEIAQGGKNISGGQKQRLSIARAIARRPEIMIFDDSFSALDFKTDKKLRKALDDELKDTTIVMVSQRIGTIKDCDQIVVLDDGKIAGIGKHQDLIKNCSVYQEIALSQLDKEEL